MICYVEQKLLEETNYHLEIKQSIEISDACKHIPNMRFPSYYPALSSEKIISMEWMDGKHLSEYCAQETDPEKRKAYLLKQQEYDQTKRAKKNK